MQKLISGVWIECTEEDLVAGDIYRIPVGDGGWQQQVYSEPEPIIDITMTADKTVMSLGETLNFTLSFSDKTFTGHVTISVTDRQNTQLDNIGVEVVLGECNNGTYTPVKSLDYFVTNVGINFYNTGVKYVMDEEFNIRVESA